jgi:hypothetical protein
MGGRRTYPLNICRAGGEGYIPDEKVHKEKYIDLLQKFSFNEEEPKHRSSVSIKTVSNVVQIV